MNIVTNLLTIQNQLRVFHWQTQKKPGSFAQHEAFGKAYEELDPLVDDFIEVYQGKRGALMGKNGFTLNLENLSDNYEAFIDEAIQYLVDYLPSALDQNKDTDLLNIRDEMMAILNQTKYRLHMM
jgi:DNA-binding ferritin-like protein